MVSRVLYNSNLKKNFFFIFFFFVFLHNKNFFACDLALIKKYFLFLFILFIFLFILFILYILTYLKLFKIEKEYLVVFPCLQFVRIQDGILFMILWSTDFAFFIFYKNSRKVFCNIHSIENL